jgi:photosystem II stability/assembly factor-like uncharacterized protein
VYSDSLAQKIRKIKFYDQLTGTVLCDSGVVLITLDGGVNWLKKILPVSVRLNDIAFFNDSIYFIAGNSGKIFRSIDKGNSWTVDSFPVLKRVD